MKHVVKLKLNTQAFQTLNFSIQRALCILTAYPLGVIVDVLDSQWSEHDANCFSWYTHLSTEGDTNTFRRSFSVCRRSHANQGPLADGRIGQPDVGADVHFAALQRCVHRQVNGVRGLAAVVLVDEHRVFGDVKACGVPVGEGVSLFKNVGSLKENP